MRLVVWPLVFFPYGYHSCNMYALISIDCAFPERRVCRAQTLLFILTVHVHWVSFRCYHIVWNVCNHYQLRHSFTVCIRTPVAFLLCNLLLHVWELLHLLRPPSQSCRSSHHSHGVKICLTHIGAIYRKRTYCCSAHIVTVLTDWTFVFLRPNQIKLLLWFRKHSELVFCWT